MRAAAAAAAAGAAEQEAVCVHPHRRQCNGLKLLLVASLSPCFFAHNCHTALALCGSRTAQQGLDLHPCMHTLKRMVCCM